MTKNRSNWSVIMGLLLCQTCNFLREVLTGTDAIFSFHLPWLNHEQKKPPFMAAKVRIMSIIDVFEALELPKRFAPTSKTH